MACSYLSAGMKPETSAACWTPPNVAGPLPDMEGPSGLPAAPFMRPPAMIGVPTNPGLPQEPALDLTTTPSLKPRLPSSPSDDDTE